MFTALVSIEVDGILRTKPYFGEEEKTLFQIDRFPIQNLPLKYAYLKICSL